MSMPEGAQQTLMNLAKSLMQRIPSVTPDPISVVAGDDEDIRSKFLVLSDQNEQLSVKVSQMFVSSFSKGYVFMFSQLEQTVLESSHRIRFLWSNLLVPN